MKKGRNNGRKEGKQRKGAGEEGGRAKREEER